MDVGPVLIDLIVVLVAARLAAEVAERIRQPAVLLEILLGIVVGPSVLGLVGEGQALHVLGEIGVILLLFEVGRQTDLAELTRVGRSSLVVAVIGVVAPMALAYPAMLALGVPSAAALFLAAGITATSVGITARVFGDLRALATTEARTVLGAAVADDVIGLLVLTIVVRWVSAEALSAQAIAGIFGVAIAFILVAATAGAWAVRWLLNRIARRERVDGTVSALALAAAFGVARLGQAVGLAPIVGAFVAGLAVGGSRVAEDVHRRITPLTHFFVPIFFLQIGVNTDAAAFAKPGVLGLAAVLSVIAVAGKLVSGLGVPRRSANRWVIGVGMIPRGEVGLIFASIGLARGALDAETYAVLLLVVLISTVITPPWLKAVVIRVRRRVRARDHVSVEPQGGWLTTDGDVELAADPPPALAARVGLEAAIASATRRPGPRLAEFLEGAQDERLVWDEQLRRSFFEVLERGNERSWRFLEVTGLLRALLPELDKALRRRAHDPFDLDPAGAVRLPTVEGLQSLRARKDRAGATWEELGRPREVLLAALARDAFDGDPEAGAESRRLALALGVDAETAGTVGRLVDEGDLLTAAARRLETWTEDRVLELAAHLETRERARALYVLEAARGSSEPWERRRLDELLGLLEEAFDHPDLVAPSARELVERRIEEVAGRRAGVPARQLRERLWAAPWRYLLSQDAEAIARHVDLMDTRPGRFEARLFAEPLGGGEWGVHIAVLDRAGVLAAITGALSAHGISVLEAQVFTWRNQMAVDVFRVAAPTETDWDGVRREIEAALAHPEAAAAASGPLYAEVDIDNRASPWYTILEVRARDRVGLLHRVASALSGAGLQIDQASVQTREGVAVDTFWITGRRGGKLDEAEERLLAAALEGRAPSRRRRLGTRIRRARHTRVG